MFDLIKNIFEDSKRTYYILLWTFTIISVILLLIHIFIVSLPIYLFWVLVILVVFVFGFLLTYGLWKEKRDTINPGIAIGIGSFLLAIGITLYFLLY